jgi:hypothetical protein
MYYLVVKNLGVEKCIDMNEEDIYISNSFYNCQQELALIKKVFVRRIKIRCSGIPGKFLYARIFKD